MRNTGHRTVLWLASFRSEGSRGRQCGLFKVPMSCNCAAGTCDIPQAKERTSPHRVLNQTKKLPIHICNMIRGL